MADLAQLESALVNADKAGDAAAAKVLAAEISRIRGAMSGSRDLYSTDPTEGMSGAQKFAAGAGKALTDFGRGAGQLVGLVDRRSVDESKKRDAPLMRTGAGIAGNVAGNVLAAAPLSLVPGANTVAGGALIGAASGALQPVGTEDSRLKNTAIGGAAGAAVPLAIRSAKALKAGLVDPFTEAGRTGIAGNLISSSAADPDAVIQRLSQAQGATPGFLPTVGQAADDNGVAALERTMRAIDPRGFDEVEKSQRAALIEALRNVAKTPEARQAAINEADSAVRPLYDAAKKAVVSGDDEIAALLQRPSMSAAQERAARIAAERGASLPSMADNLYSGSMLHDMKMGLDDAIGNPGLGGMQGAERNAALGTKEQFLSWLENKIPEYGQAKNTYAEKMLPVNQMDIGQELYNRFVPALNDFSPAPFRTTANQFAKALREGDDLARNVTGLKGVTMDKVMGPDNMKALRGVAEDAALAARMEGAGRGAGSDTVQKIAMSNIAQQAGVPTWLSNVGKVPGGWIKRAGDLLYGSADEQIRAKVAELLRDPQAAAEAMRRAGMPPSEIANALRASAQSLAIGAAPMVEAGE